MPIAIKFENISKKYRLGEIGTGTLSHDLHRIWARMLGRPDPFAKVGAINDRTQKATSFSGASRSRNSNVSDDGNTDYVWALKDISLDVQQGEILGVIGRNGAGKSTLLKLLSRVTAPTTGSINAKGRIASLLEVGTGFHPELTGRENIYLNGAILGMRRHEISRQLDDIVEFSGCAKYIDTPVKRYSSGMTVRLGFAVAAHLDCEILVVDEVLAVGDAEFQKKCIGKMQEISSENGKTVLFVSHNMASVLKLCTKGLVIAAGQAAFLGSPRESVDLYLAGGYEKEDKTCYVSGGQRKKNDIVILEADCGKKENVPKTRFAHDEQIEVNIRCRANHLVTGAEVRMVVRDGALRTVFTTDTAIGNFDNHTPFDIRAKVSIPGNFLRPGHYWLTFATFIPDVLILDLVEDIFSITVFDGGTKYAASEGLDYGCVFAPCKWTIDAVDNFES